MNPRELVDVLKDMRESIFFRVPWIVGGPSERHIALAKDRSGGMDWFPVSHKLYETVEKLSVKMGYCQAMLMVFERVCREHGIKG